MSVTQQVQENAVYHKSLLDQLAALEQAPSALESQIRYLDELNKDLAKSSTAVRRAYLSP